jgi:uncharacterized protein DUF6714
VTGTDRLQEAAQAMDVAFSRTERPANSDLLHPRCMDDGDLLELYEVSDWREMSDELVVNNYAAPSFLSAAGFQYFLPAFISYALRNPESPEFVIESTIFHLTPGDDFTESRFELFDGPQRHAIRLFLEAMAPNYEVEAAVAYWTPR